MDQSRRLNRRHFLGLTALTTTGLLAACATPATTPSPTATSATASGAASGTSPAAASPTALPKVTTPSGSLRIALGNGFPPTLDAGRSGGMTLNGIGETLIRLSPDLKLEPWLAQNVTNVDPLTWRVQLRPNARFHDGSPVDSEAVIASLRRLWELRPGNNLLISNQSQLTIVDPTTFTIRTPEPQSDLLYNLASSEFVIHKPAPENTSIMTGPYRVERFVSGREMNLVPFMDHWAGPPPIARLTILNIVDSNARTLGLEAGDIDMVYGLAPESLATLSPNIERVVKPTTRIHYMPLNHMREPFNDRNVREATAIAIDRASLIRAVMDGTGAPIAGLFPSGIGIDVVEGQREDPARARRLLDEAGWRLGADGVRVKDGRRLQFVIHGWPNRAELTPLGVAIAGQLKAFGYDLTVQEVRDIRAQMQSGDFSAAMFSNNTMSAGPQRIFANTLFKGATDNYGGYSNPELEAVIGRVRNEFDPGRQTALLRQAQEIVLRDAANIYLLATPWAVGWRRGKVANYVFHPSDVFFIDHSLRAGA